MRHLTVRRIGAGALALALSACHGPDEVSVGGAGMLTPPNPAFLSPKGDDQNPGTQAEPWKTFKAALPRLRPGSTLTLLEGTYDGGSTGYLNARCVAGPGGAANATSGTDDTPAGRITVNAAGHVFLRGDDSGPPLSIAGCAHWVLEGLHAEAAELETAPNTPEAGSVVVVGSDTHDLTLRHLLLAHPNRYRHSHLLHIGEGSHNVLVEECELYDFHENAVETARTSALTFRRNYLNSRGTVDNGYRTAYEAGGDFGFFFEETSGVIAENNIVENVHDGFGIVGRDNMLDANVPPPNPPDGNRLLGNIVYQPEGSGVRIDSRCKAENPCPPSRIVRRTELIDDIVIGGAVGVSVAGAIGTSVQQVTVINAANGFLSIKEPQNGAIMATSSTANSLAIVQAYAFRSEGEMDFGFTNCAAFSTATASGVGISTLYRPDDDHVRGRIAAPGDLSGCYVNLPAGSPLRGVGIGAHDVGANVVNAYVDGTLTSTPLWTAAGGFPCGTVVSGVNDETGTSCIGVNKRLHVTPAGSPPSATSCPLP